MAGPLFDCIDKGKYILVAFWTLLTIGMIISTIVGTSLASKSPSGYPDDNPIQRRSNIQQEYFASSNSEQMKVVWGLDEEEAVKSWGSFDEDKGQADVETV